MKSNHTPELSGNRSVGRPEDRRIQRSREALEEALLGLILEKRYEKITVQDILDRAGVARSTFYAHFQDKEHLLTHGFGRLAAHLNAGLDTDPLNRDDGKPLFGSLVFFRHAHQQRNLHRAMVEGGGADALLQVVRKYLEQEIRAAIPEGEANTVPSPLIARFLAGAMIAVSSWWLETGEQYSPEEIDAFFRKLAINGLKGAERS